MSDGTNQPTHTQEFLPVLAEQLNGQMMKLLATRDFELVSNGDLIKDLVGRTLYFGRLVPVAAPVVYAPVEGTFVKGDGVAGTGEATQMGAGVSIEGAIELTPVKEGKLVEFPVHPDAPAD